MGKKRGIRIDLGNYPLPPQTQMLGPEWLAAFSIYWRSNRSDLAKGILDLAEAARLEPVAERSVYLLQKALRQLGVVEISIIKLVLTRYLHFVRTNAPEPPQQIAAEVLATLLAVEADRARGGRPRKQS